MGWLSLAAMRERLQLRRALNLTNTPVVYDGIADLIGETGNNGVNVHVGGYYASSYYSLPQKGGGFFVWDSAKAKSSHNGVTVISPTVAWNGTQATLSAFHAKTGETDPSGSGCWVRQFDVIDVFMAGAIGDGVIDDSTAIQAAINYVNSVGGGVVFLPSGTYRKSDDADTQLVMYSNIKITGNGDSSIIFFDDKSSVARFGNDLLVADNCNNIAFENFKITGTALTYTTETNQKQCLTGSVIDGLRIINVTFEKLRYMATSFSYVKNGYFAGNKLDYIVRDGFRCTNSENIVITGNILKRVADDAVALHSLDSASTPGSGFIVSNNIFEACQGVKILGAKVAKVTNNTLRRCLRNPIKISLAGTGTEGNTPMFSIDVSNNTITDTFGSLGTNYAIQIAVSLARSVGDQSNQPGVNSTTYTYNYTNNVDAGGTIVNLGMWGIRVNNNTIARTLKSGSAYSVWGYGQLFDRFTTNFISDPDITESHFQLHAINIVAPVNGLQIQDNSISGCGTGFSAILLQITGSSNIQDFSSALIQNNSIIDCPGLGISCLSLGSGSGSKQIIIQNNLIDLDPYFRASTHNADNTWTSTTGVVGISVSSTIGFLAGANIFKNCGQTGIVSSITTEISPNIVYCDFAGSGDNASNKGVRQLPQAAINIIVPINGDPTSSTFGQIANNVNIRSSSIPTTGRYVAGHRVWKDSPALLGSGGSQYIVTGWIRSSTGSNHVLNTDWYEMRTLTGT